MLVESSLFDELLESYPSCLKSINSILQASLLTSSHRSTLLGYCGTRLLRELQEKLQPSFLRDCSLQSAAGVYVGVVITILALETHNPFSDVGSLVSLGFASEWLSSHF